jgi:hypothetical protein
MAKYTEDFPIGELETKCVFEADFSFSGETNTGEGLDLKNFLEKWNSNIGNITKSVEQIISNNQDYN